MKIIQIIKGKQYIKSVFPHNRTLIVLGLEMSDLSKKIKGRIRLLNKFIELSLIRGKYYEEEDSFYAFSDRISNEIMGKHIHLN